MGKTRPKRVFELARECGMDPEEALVSLWEEEPELFDYLLEPTELIHKTHVQKARRALGLGTTKESRSTQYWMNTLNCTLEDLNECLAEIPLQVERDTRLPKKAQKVLRRVKWNLPYVKSPSGQPLNQSDHSPDSPEEMVLEWEAKGHHDKEIKYLTTKEVKQIHMALREEFRKAGETLFWGIRSDDILSSATLRQHTAIGDTLKYSTPESAGAALLHSLVMNHPFNDGNKRTATVSFLVFLDRNGIFTEFTEDELFSLVLRIATHRIAKGKFKNQADAEVMGITEWLRSKSRLEEKGNKQLSWQRLRNLLTTHGCEFVDVPGQSRSVRITRTLVFEKSKGAFNIFSKRSKDLSTKIIIPSDGRDLSEGTLKKIRAELKLDHAEGYDFINFYSRDPIQPSQFIVRYKRTLKRLANV